MAAANAQLTGALGRLIAVAEIHDGDDAHAQPGNALVSIALRDGAILVAIMRHLGLDSIVHSESDILDGLVLSGGLPLFFHTVQIVR